MATKKKKDERLSGFYKQQIVEGLLKAMDGFGLTKTQMRRIFSYGYQSLRAKREAK